MLQVKVCFFLVEQERHVVWLYNIRGSHHILQARTTEEDVEGETSLQATGSTKFKQHLLSLHVAIVCQSCLWPWKDELVSVQEICSARSGTKNLFQSRFASLIYFASCIVFLYYSKIGCNRANHWCSTEHIDIYEHFHIYLRKSSKLTTWFIDVYTRV